MAVVKSFLLSLFLCCLLLCNVFNAQKNLFTTNIASSFLHTYAIDAENNLYAWGTNGFGELGLGSNTSPPNAYFPVYVDVTNTVLKGKKIVAVAAGASHTLVLDSAGVVYAWGKNEFGQLGDGSNSDKLQPVAIGGLLANKNIAYIGAGLAHSVACENLGACYAWGANTYGQLGDKTTIQKNTPVLVFGTGSATGLKKIIRLSVGYWHNIIQDDGSVLYAFGRNHEGQLGDASTTDRSDPVAVDASLIGTRVRGFSAGAAHSLAYTTDNAGFAWGTNNHGQLGDGFHIQKSYPTQIVASKLKNIQAIAAGSVHSLAVDMNGAVFAWGNNMKQQLGISKALNDSNAPIAVMVDASSALFGKKITTVSAGFDHSVALGNQVVYTWGGNSNGQLGTGASDDRSIPIAVNCRPGWYGVNCELPVCYGLPATNVLVCAGHGVCGGPDSCRCASGYGGSMCQDKLFPWNILDFLFGTNTFAVPAGASFFAFIAVVGFCAATLLIFCFIVILAACLFLIPFEICSKAVGSLMPKKNQNAATIANEVEPYKIMPTQV